VRGGLHELLHQDGSLLLLVRGHCYKV
jgi:hypothetical protein